MGNISRRDFLAVAAVLGAEAAWGRSFSTPSKISWRERRDLFPEGMASGDPDSNSVCISERLKPLR
jgi:alkaline phosphatase D